MGKKEYCKGCVTGRMSCKLTETMAKPAKPESDTTMNTIKTTTTMTTATTTTTSAVEKECKNKQETHGEKS